MPILDSFRRWSDGRALFVTAVWIPAVVFADRTASLAGQLVLGAAIWALLFYWLRHESPLVRAQTLVVVAIATVFEYLFSGHWGIYLYRLGHVPAYVPPGHGLVCLGALVLGRNPLVRRHARLAVRATVLVAGAWALYGLLLSPRRDFLGFFWYVCLLVMLRWGPSTLLYVGAFVVVSYLELIGTRWGVWTWQPVDTIKGWVPMGNPPSIAAGGYGWFDLWAVLAAPAIVRRWQALRGGRSQTPQAVLPSSEGGARTALGRRG